MVQKRSKIIYGAALGCTIGAFLFSYLFVQKIFAKEFSFDVDLKYGDSNTDVLELQKFLNRFDDTCVAEFGPGSVSNETNYFGVLTRKAVMKFQEKYKNEILIPNGIKGATSYVGIFTRKKINHILKNELNGAKIEKPLTQTNSTSTNLIPKNDVPVKLPPLIYDLSGVDFSPGDTLTISGKDFSGLLAFHIGENKISDFKEDGSSKITVSVPNEKGVLMVWMENENGDSRMLSPIFIVVSDKSAPRQSDVMEAIRIVEQNNNIIKKLNAEL